ncbi:MAG: hypothetical protein A2W85_10790 [Bacteroidetes bacterium GWF2_41_31]|nr:MAG: hypothetical protein A2W85_10790 [Bacteroidetes bacterium GWF2_41_31]
MYFSRKVLAYYEDIESPVGLPDGVEVMNPYSNPEVQRVLEAFYTNYYQDNKKRKLILGINPGRLGAGITGIPFTDPIRLEKDCDIKNGFVKKGELSSEFVYKLIAQMGGPAHFYRHFYIGSVSPLGFLKDGKNYNYYDSLDLKRGLKPYIINSLISQISFGVETTTCYCMGQGKNFDYLKMLNDEFHLFKKIVPLPHPRWVMQYKRKELDFWINETIQLLIK